MYGKQRSTLLARLGRWLRMNRSKNELDQFEPVYGLTWQALREWLKDNPNCREGYQRKLLRKGNILSSPSI
jgi:hypothetical protein